MIRRLTMAIFTLYMKYLLSSYTKHMGCINVAGRTGGRHEISNVSWRLGDVDTCGDCYCMLHS